MSTAPFDSLREAAVDLRRPFDALAIKWKVQSTWPKDKTGVTKPEGGQVVCYIDRGLVIDRLNLLVPHLWSPVFEERERNHMLCRLTIDGITREDVGEGATLKARYSDSLKRAAVHFGVGVSLSRVPASRMKIEDGGLRVFGSEGKWGVDFTQQGLDYLRRRYETWLTERGKDAFGDPLSHGDDGDAQGDDETPDSLILDDQGAIDMLVVLSETGLTLRQQVALLAHTGVQILPTADAQEVAKAVSTLTQDQAEKLDELIAQRAGGSR
ncbi:MAG TPA: hypothetical protein VGF95_14295 [Solirubrobacteraceae bacterium]